MNRDKIKILEFGLDDDGPSRRRPTGDGAMKIIEFDKTPDDSRKRVATAKDVGHIKIVEFGNEPEPRKIRMSEKIERRVGPMKIKEFDKEAAARESIAGTPKIKIVEFD